WRAGSRVAWRGSERTTPRKNGPSEISGRTRPRGRCWSRASRPTARSGRGDLQG
ncbi:MAG: hypothetical protein AVDCRST_MAG01-01-1885, partial [uncultured Rubrobacteraceae bacterium]